MSWKLAVLGWMSTRGLWHQGKPLGCDGIPLDSLKGGCKVKDMKRLLLIGALCGIAFAQSVPTEYQYPAAPRTDPGYAWFKQLLIKSGSTIIPCPTLKQAPAKLPEWAVCAESNSGPDTIRLYIDLTEGAVQDEPFNSQGATVMLAGGKAYIFSIQQVENKTFLTFAPETK